MQRRKGSPVFCMKCGAPVQEGAVSCGICGTDFRQSVPVSPPRFSQPAKPRTDSRNAVCFALALLSAAAFVGTLFVMSLTAKLPSGHETGGLGQFIYSRAEREIARIAAGCAVFGFILGLAGVISAPKKEMRNTLGICGMILSASAMTASAIIAIRFVIMMIQ